MSLTVEQLEAARAERMRQNGHGAITIEDVRTWIEETGLCIFLPRSTQAGIQAGATSSTATPTFVEAVAGQRTSEPSLELIASAESLLVRLESEGVAVRLNLSGQPHNQFGDQPDYVVAGWVLPYIYALRGDRDWRRSPQLTGSRQVSQLAVQAAKQIDTANMNAGQIRDALGREVTESAVLRALHELWKQLRIIPVVPEVGSPALWQPLRQRFQKAIAEGASTSQVTAISVLASIYLQAVIAASMEDVELFLSPLTARSKIREVVRGLAATRQVHSTTLGQSPMFYVAGTLPEFPAVPSFQISSAYTPYRSTNYRGLANRSSANNGSAYLASYLGHAQDEDLLDSGTLSVEDVAVELAASTPVFLESEAAPAETTLQRKAPARPAARPATRAAAPSAGKSSQPRPRSVGPVHPRERSRTATAGTESRPSAGSDRRRVPAPRNGNGNGSTRSNGTTNGTANSASNGLSNGAGNGASNGTANGNGSGRKPAAASAAKRYSFSGQAKQVIKPSSKAGSKPSQSARPSDSKRRG